uniref:U1 small nuclear ribonucleoprotein of 70kDa N-terminal domain-containing protein n=1 Tax=Geospiza parvula TaxID=87175 RepID=A0A8U8C3F4_GEOPR
MILGWVQGVLTQPVPPPRPPRMTQFLPPNLLALLAPRDPIPYLPPLEKLPHEKHHNQPYSGITPYIREFEVPPRCPPRRRAPRRARSAWSASGGRRSSEGSRRWSPSSSSGTPTMTPTLKEMPSKPCSWPE